MKEYGYVNEDGYLHSRVIEEYQERYLEGNVVKTRTVSEEEQIKALTKVGWKPIDVIDNSKLKTDDGYIIRLVPYDAGDCVKFRYERVYDVQKHREKIKQLQDELTATDYKIIKCYEASLAGEELPYDFATIRAERQAMRDKINQIQVHISGLD